MTGKAKKAASKEARRSTKGRKLKPRDPKKVCGAKTDHGPCQQWAGYKTDHVGVGACARHLGATKNHNASADRQMVAEHARTYGTPIETDPKAGLLQEVARSVGVVAWLELRVGNLSEDGQGEQLLEKTMFGNAPSVWIKQFEKERAHLARVCKWAIDTGVQQEYLDWMKDRGQQLGQTFKALLTDERMALTPEQMDAAKTVVQELMQKALSS